MRVESMPIVGLGNAVPAPIRWLEVFEDNPCLAILVCCIAPDIEVALGTTWWRKAGSLEPRVLIGCVIEHQLRNHANPAIVSRGQQLLKIGQRAVSRVDA